MPYKSYKKTYKKPGRFQKAGRFADKHTGTAMKALNLAKKVARMVNVEYKAFDSDFSGGVDNAGGIVNIFTPVQGSNYDQRDGDSVKPLRLSGRLFITQNGSAQKTALRIIIFRGKQENQQPYTVADVLQIPSHLAPKATHERFRTKILYDKLYHMSNNGNSSIVANYDFKLFGHTLFANDDTEVENGGIYVLVISNENANFPVVNWYLRTSYTDN